MDMNSSIRRTIAMLSVLGSALLWGFGAMAEDQASKSSQESQIGPVKVTVSGSVEVRVSYRSGSSHSRR